MEAGIGVGDDVLEVAEDHEAVVGRVRGQRGAGCEEVWTAGELVVEVGGGVGDDADGEVEAGNGLEGRHVSGGVVDGRGVDGAELATVEEEKEAANNVFS